MVFKNGAKIRRNYDMMKIFFLSQCFLLNCCQKALSFRFRKKTSYISESIEYIVSLHNITSTFFCMFTLLVEVMLKLTLMSLILYHGMMALAVMLSLPIFVLVSTFGSDRWLGVTTIRSFRYFSRSTPNHSSVTTRMPSNNCPQSSSRRKMTYTHPAAKAKYITS